MTNEIKIVIGSWGSYNTCNEHVLGSEWFCLNNYSDWGQIAEELKKQGFRLEELDAELFVQDIDGLPSGCENWDYISPKELFETLKESGVLHSEYLYTVLCAYLEVRSFREFAERVEKFGNNWDDDIYIYEGYDWEDYGRELFEGSDRHLDDDLADYFDFEAYGRSFGLSCAEEYSGGIIEIL